jgi:hypothetical protein
MKAEMNFDNIGGGISFLEPTYYCDQQQVKQISSNQATGRGGVYSSAVIANITDLGYTSVSCSAANTGYIYDCVVWKKDGTFVDVGSGGSGSKTFTIPSDTAILFVSAGASNTGTGTTLSLTFS